MVASLSFPLFRTEEPREEEEGIEKKVCGGFDCTKREGGRRRRKSPLVGFSELIAKKEEREKKEGRKNFTLSPLHSAAHKNIQRGKFEYEVTFLSPTLPFSFPLSPILTSGRIWHGNLFSLWSTAFFRQAKKWELPPFRFG